MVETLKDWREAKDWTQEELAGKVGTNQKAYSAYETGRNKVPADIQRKIRKLGYAGPWPSQAAQDLTLADLKRIEELLTEKAGAIREDLRGVGAVLQVVLERLQQLEENALAKKP